MIEYMVMEMKNTLFVFSDSESKYFLKEKLVWWIKKYQYLYWFYKLKRILRSRNIYIYNRIYQDRYQQIYLSDYIFLVFIYDNGHFT